MTLFGFHEVSVSEVVPALPDAPRCALRALTGRPPVTATNLTAASDARESKEEFWSRPARVKLSKHGRFNQEIKCKDGVGAH